MNSGILWIRIVQALLLLVCLLATAGVCYVGVIARRRGDSRGKQVRYILFGSGLGLVFGVSVNAVFLMERMVMRDVVDSSSAKTLAQFFCCSAVSALVFAAAVVQFLWLRRDRRR